MHSERTVVPHSKNLGGNHKHRTTFPINVKGQYNVVPIYAKTYDDHEALQYFIMDLTYIFRITRTILFKLEITQKKHIYLFKCLINFKKFQNKVPCNFSSFMFNQSVNDRTHSNTQS